MYHEVRNRGDDTMKVPSKSGSFKSFALGSESDRVEWCFRRTGSAVLVELVAPVAYVEWVSDVLCDEQGQ